MGSYRLSIKPSAAKELESLDRKRDRERIVDHIRSLASGPRPHGCEKLTGAIDLYRLRVGVHRVVFSIDDSAREVVVIKIGHRRDVHR